MKHTRILLIVAILSFAAFSCKQEAKQTQDKEQKEQKEEKQAPGDGRMTVDGYFKAAFPERPDKTEETIEANGTQVKKFTYTYSPEPLENYTVTYSEFPEGQFKGKDPEKVLQATRDGILKELGGPIAEEKTLEGNYPGLMFKSKSGNMHYVYHLYLYKNRLVQAVISKNKEYPEDTSFLGSIEILD